jgi:hypothetical protein
MQQAFHVYVLSLPIQLLSLLALTRLLESLSSIGWSHFEHIYIFVSIAQSSSSGLGQCLLQIGVRFLEHQLPPLSRDILITDLVLSTQLCTDSGDHAKLQLQVLQGMQQLQHAETPTVSFCLTTR